MTDKGAVCDAASKLAVGLLMAWRDGEDWAVVDGMLQDRLAAIDEADRAPFATNALLSLLPIASTYMDLMDQDKGDGMTADELLQESAVMLMEPEPEQ